VPELEAEVGSRGKTPVEVRLPGKVSVEIGGTNAEDSARRRVHVAFKLKVVHLNIKMDLALSEEETTSDPVNVRVLESSARSRPLRGPRCEPNPLLAAGRERVDNSRSIRLGEAFVGGKRGNNLGSSGVGDGGRVVPETGG
jgi:hypothetical protein